MNLAIFALSIAFHHPLKSLPLPIANIRLVEVVSKENEITSIHCNTKVYILPRLETWSTICYLIIRVITHCTSTEHLSKLKGSDARTEPARETHTWNWVV